MKQMIQPVSGPINGEVTVPGSKSITNRALILAALSNATSHLSGVLHSDDSEACVVALQALGAKIDWGQSVATATVTPIPVLQHDKVVEIECRDAGTATRFLLPVCAAMQGQYRFSASARMSERPIGPLLVALIEQGAVFNFEAQSQHMPLLMHADGLGGGDVSVDITQSSQFLSGLLLAAPYAKSPITLQASTMANKPYVSMTLAMMGQFGVDAIVQDSSIIVPQGCYHGCDYTIEPDASTASYFFAMAALTGGRVTVNHMRCESLQGDVRFLDVLADMGCQVHEDAQGITVVGPKQLKGLGEHSMSGFSDTFMTVAALAVFADAPTTLTGLAHTRLQESDRVAAMAEGLVQLGVQTDTTQDSITIYPAKPHGGTVASHNDHRIAMSLSLIGLKTQGVTIEGAEAVKKTCPDYFTMMTDLTEV